MGTYAELLASSPSLFASLLHNINQDQQQEHPNELKTQWSRVDSTYSENEDETESSVMLTNVDTKKEGSVSWHVYVAYWRAGVGFAFGFLLILLVYLVQQATSIFSNWWLVAWSDDENHRYHIFSDCNVTIGQINNSVRMMTGAEWKDQRNRKFYVYCGLLTVSFLFRMSRIFVKVLF
jgi:hypothetical protein